MAQSTFNGHFVCFVLQPSQLIGVMSGVMSSAVSLPNHTFSSTDLVL